MAPVGRRARAPHFRCDCDTCPSPTVVVRQGPVSPVTGPFCLVCFGLIGDGSVAQTVYLRSEKPQTWIRAPPDPLHSTQLPKPARSSIGGGHRPFKAERRVQFPHGLL